MADQAKITQEQPPNPTQKDYPVRLNQYLERQLRLLQQRLSGAIDTGTIGTPGADGAPGSPGPPGLTGPIGPSRGINVRDFGAVGNGVTDDAAAIQAAITYAVSSNIRHVYIPGGTYLITSSINLCGIFGLRIEGAVGYQVGVHFRCQTGSTPAFDITGSTDIRMEHVYIEGLTAGSPSRVGILMARSMTSGTEFITLENVTIRLASNSAANGGVGTVGVYCFCAELGSIRDCHIMSDNAIVFTRDNLYSVITSPHVTMSTASISMSEWTIDRATKLSGGLGPALTFVDAHNIRIQGYISRLDAPGDGGVDGTPYAYAMKFVAGALGTIRMIAYDGLIEYFPSAAFIDCPLDNCSFKTLAAHLSGASQFVFANRTAGIRQCEFRVNPGDNSAHRVIEMTQGSWGMTGSTIYLFLLQSIYAPNASDWVSNIVVNCGATDAGARITLGTGYAVKAFVSGNVQGAMGLVTPTCVPVVSSVGTVAQDAGVTIQNTPVSGGVWKRFVTRNSATGTGDEAGFWGEAGGGTNYVFMTQHGTGHTTPNEAWVSTAGAVNDLVIGTQGVERVRVAGSDGAVTFKTSITHGDASTDLITNIGRLILRTIAADPTATATAGTIGEVVYSSSTTMFYGKHTSTGTDTNWVLLASIIGGGGTPGDLAIFTGAGQDITDSGIVLDGSGLNVPAPAINLTNSGGATLNLQATSAALSITAPSGGGEMVYNASSSGGRHRFVGNTTVEVIRCEGKGIFTDTLTLATADLKFTGVGKGIYLKEGTNATAGIVTLVAGTATVNTTKVTANSRIYLTRQTVAGTLGASVDVTARTAGTSFTITANGSILDTSTVAWLIIEPS